VNNGLQQAISYKDPSGFVVKAAGEYYRLVANRYATEYDHLIQSGLYDTLTTQRLMVSHTEVPLTEAHPDCYKRLYPQQLNFISYPFEWSYGQWRQVLLTYININKIALEHGMILKDATSYNFTFCDNKCILVDTLSFDFYNDEGPWLAYKQFCEEMLSPLLLMYYKDPNWAKLYSAAINGLPLFFVSRHLPFYTRFNFFCLVHIHLHSKFQQVKRSGNTGGSGLNKDKLQMLFKMLQKNVVKRKQPLLKNSIWDNYYQNDIESDAYLADKERIVTAWLSGITPGVTIDLGANTGKFSVIAAQISKQVYAVENDTYCVDELYQNIQASGHNNILPLVADITDPSPGLGWNNDEKTPLLHRLKCDTVMALALVHHLCLSKNIPLHFIAALLADITSGHAIVEFVPKTDAKSKLLLELKGDIFDHYTEEEFVASFKKYFKLSASHMCEDSTRKLFLWQKI